MSDIADAGHHVLARTLAFATSHHISLYVVGGAIRDALLPESSSAKQTTKPLNIDLAVPSGALAVGRQLATTLGATYIVLDEASGCVRLVLPESEARVELDLADFRADSLKGDLARRDFTINAMAMPLEAWCAQDGWRRALVDPLGGVDDLRAKRLRACSARSFEDDPVRILRAWRFAASLDCAIDAKTSTLMAASVPRLGEVAGERVRDELFAILETDRAGVAFAQLNALGVMDVLFHELSVGRGMDQGGFHHLDVLGHQLETIVQCDRMLSDFAEFSLPLREPLAAYCKMALVEGRSRKALIKLSGLFHDVGKPGTRRVEADGDIWFIGHEQFGASIVEAMTERLKLSNREREMIRTMVLYHLRPGHLSREKQLTRRAVFRFFRDLDEDGPACLIVWWADRMSTRGPSSRLDQIDQQRARLEELFNAYFFRADEVIRPPRLLDGRQLMAALAIKPGPLVGKLLQSIEESQAEGRIASPDEALALARKLVQEHGRS